MNGQKLLSLAGRCEDRRFVVGAGRYTADLMPGDALHAVFLRSTIARGRIRHLLIDAARSAVGVSAILTADDAAQDGVEYMVWTGAPVRDDGAMGSDSQRPLLSRAMIRHLGEPVCMIIAKTRQAALDAMELIDVAYDADDEIASVSYTHLTLPTICSV